MAYLKVHSIRVNDDLIVVLFAIIFYGLLNSFYIDLLIRKIPTIIVYECNEKNIDNWDYLMLLHF